MQIHCNFYSDTFTDKLGVESINGSVVQHLLESSTISDFTQLYC